MPTYEYKCKECDHEFELWQEVGAEAPACPECGAEVGKIFRPIRTIFKGSGFYITDSRPAPSEAKSEKPSTETKSESKSEDKAKSGDSSPKKEPAKAENK